MQTEVKLTGNFSVDWYNWTSVSVLHSNGVAHMKLLSVFWACHNKTIRGMKLIKLCDNNRLRLFFTWLSLTPLLHHHWALTIKWFNVIDRACACAYGWVVECALAGESSFHLVLPESPPLTPSASNYVEQPRLADHRHISVCACLLFLCHTSRWFIKRKSFL